MVQSQGLPAEWLEGFATEGRLFVAPLPNLHAAPSEDSLFLDWWSFSLGELATGEPQPRLADALAAVRGSQGDCGLVDLLGADAADSLVGSLLGMRAASPHRHATFLQSVLWGFAEGQGIAGALLASMRQDPLLTDWSAAGESSILSIVARKGHERLDERKAVAGHLVSPTTPSLDALPGDARAGGTEEADRYADLFMTLEGRPEPAGLHVLHCPEGLVGWENPAALMSSQRAWVLPLDRYHWLASGSRHDLDLGAWAARGPRLSFSSSVLSPEAVPVDLSFSSLEGQGPRKRMPQAWVKAMDKGKSGGRVWPVERRRELLAKA